MKSIKNFSCIKFYDIKLSIIIGDTEKTIFRMGNSKYVKPSYCSNWTHLGETKSSLDYHTYKVHGVQTENITNDYFGNGLQFE